MDPPLTKSLERILKRNKKATKSLKCDNIDNLCLCFKEEQTCRIITS